MKATSVKSGVGFAPVKIIITCESQDELDLLGGLFNFTPVCDLFENADLLYREFQGAGAAIGRFNSVIRQKIKNHPVMR